jgi:PAS domain S-box-containing protein
LNGEIATYSQEFPFHSPGEKRWFMCHVTLFAGEGPIRVVIASENITAQMLYAELLAEQKYQLFERVKELNCLHTHARLLEQPDLALEALCQMTVDLMPPAWQYPEITCASLKVGNYRYTTTNFEATTWSLKSDVFADQEYFGSLEVFYLEAKPEAAEGPFTAGERLLINELARRLGQKIEAIHAEIALLQAHDMLEARVVQRTAQLQAAKEQVEAILNNSVDGILLALPDFTIERTNPAFNRLFDCETDTYFHQPLKALFLPESDEVIFNTIQAQVKDDRQSFYREVRAHRADGSAFDAEISVGHLKDEGLVCVIRDITERKRAEETLAEERNLLRTMIDALPDLIYVKDLQHRFVMLNKAANIGGQTAAGEPAPDLIGKTDFDIQPGPRAEQYFADEEKIFHSGQPLKDYEEGGAIDKNWFLTTKVPLRNVNGQIVGLVGIGRNITERKQTEILLENRNRALTSLHAGVLDITTELDMSALLPHIMRRAIDLLHADRGGGIYLHDHEENVLKLVAVAGINEGRQGMTIQPSEGVAGHVLQTGEALIVNDYARWNGRAIVLVSDPPSAVMGVPLRIRGQVEGALLVFANSSERTFVTADQNLAEMFAAQAAAALHNARLYSAAQREISERKRTEEALRESEAKYRQLVEDLRGGLAVVDVDTRYTFVNDRFCELIGYTREEIIGSSAYTYVANTGSQILASQIEQRQKGDSSSYELTVRHKEGHLVFLLISSSPLFGKNREYTGSLAVFTDITLQKQAEEALRQALATEKELGELKSRFVSMASHEFRTPLATILAFSESLSLFRHKLTDEQIDKKLNNIRGQVEHLKNIMEDVLLLARMQARRVEFNPERANLDALCRTVIDEFKSRPDIRHPLDYICDPAISEVIVDRRLMRQIITNLVSNAIKYSPEDRSVQLSLNMTDADYLLIIRDYGIGIPEADLKHLFEPFHRASNVGTIPGTGLGLVIVKDAVELHGGAITVDSQPGEGTTFTIRLPKIGSRETQDDQNSNH